MNLYPHTVWKGYDHINVVPVEKTTAEISSEIVKRIRRNYSNSTLSMHGISEADAIELSLTLNSYPFSVGFMQSTPFDFI